MGGTLNPPAVNDGTGKPANATEFTCKSPFDCEGWLLRLLRRLRRLQRVLLERLLPRRDGLLPQRLHDAALEPWQMDGRRGRHDAGHERWIRRRGPERGCRRREPERRCWRVPGAGLPGLRCYVQRLLRMLLVFLQFRHLQLSASASIRQASSPVERARPRRFAEDQRAARRRWRRAASRPIAPSTSPAPAPSTGTLPTEQPYVTGSVLPLSGTSG